MTPPTDLEALHAHLDQMPHDWTARLVLADWYEEHGDNNRAAFQRLLTRCEKCPWRWDKRTQETNGRGEVEWNWFASGKPDNNSTVPTGRHGEVWMLSQRIFEELRMDGSLICYPSDFNKTRQQAEDYLFVHLQRCPQLMSRFQEYLYDDNG